MLACETNQSVCGCVCMCRLHWLQTSSGLRQCATYFSVTHLRVLHSLERRTSSCWDSVSICPRYRLSVGSPPPPHDPVCYLQPSCHISLLAATFLLISESGYIPRPPRVAAASISGDLPLVGVWTKTYRKQIQDNGGKSNPAQKQIDDCLKQTKNSWLIRI